GRREDDYDNLQL
nr:RecName: Full=Major 28 kDa allergen; AltName: Allergen=Vig m 28kD [Vigna mungo]